MEILLAQPVPRNRERSFAERGIDMYQGGARFVDRQILQVGDDTLTRRFFVIASGARPGSLGIPGEDLLTKSDEFLQLQELPTRLAFVGGGHIIRDRPRRGAGRSGHHSGICLISVSMIGLGRDP